MLEQITTGQLWPVQLEARVSLILHPKIAQCILLAPPPWRCAVLWTDDLACSQRSGASRASQPGSKTFPVITEDGSGGVERHNTGSAASSDPDIAGMCEGGINACDRGKTKKCYYFSLCVFQCAEECEGHLHKEMALNEEVPLFLCFINVNSAAKKWGGGGAFNGRGMRRFRSRNSAGCDVSRADCWEPDVEF